MNQGREYHGLEVAVVGMAGRFPGARDLDELWRNLATGVEAIRFFSDEELLEEGFPPDLLSRPELVKAHGALDGVDLFDAAFFGFHPREAEVTDPQHRLFLECAWEALENAGYEPGRPGSVGVYAGGGVGSYLLWNLAGREDLITLLGSDQIRLGNRPDNLATRVAYKLDLQGPAVTVQTVCSTSLVAAHLACQSLFNGECDLALAGGVSIMVPARSGYLYQPGGLLSPDGRCRAFDARARGVVAGSGLGVVVLKRLEEALADGDRVRAVVKGSAVTNDGAVKAGFTAPGVQGQVRALRAAQAAAEIDPATVTYVEAHGTGTRIGDPIEIAALNQAYGGDGNGRRCAIGSIKTNIGHLDAAAGVAGLIKTVLALEHRQLPPSLHFEEPNPEIDFAAGPFYVNTELRDWSADGGPRRAAVSSFGIGGTNAHLILEEAPPRPEPAPSRRWQLLVLSALSPAALEAATDRLVRHLESHDGESLADVAATLLAGRRAFPHRRMLVCRDHGDAVRALRERDPRRVLSRFQEGGEAPVCFLLPGLGEHAPGVTAGLYHGEPTFREHLDDCSERLRRGFGIDPRELLRLDRPEAGGSGEGPAEIDLRALLGRGPKGEVPGAEEIHRTAVAHPAVFAVEYALARLWIEWGLAPRALLGYSLGEYVAACLAGVVSLDDALRLVTERARAIDRLPAGGMLAVGLPEAAVRERLEGELEIAAINGAEVTVVAGPEAAVAALSAELEEEGHGVRQLPTRHAFHTAALSAVTPELTRLAREIELRPPEIPYVSNVTGRWIRPEEATDPAYWSRHLCGAVRFADGLGELLRLGEDLVLLEVGPGQTLSSLVWQHPARLPGHVAVPTLPSAHERWPEVEFALGALGRAWIAGAPVDARGLYRHERRARVPLPTYPFERRRYWIDRLPPRRRRQDGAAGPGLRELESPAEAPPDHPRPEVLSTHVPPSTPAERRVAGIWREFLGLASIGVHDSFFELGGSSLLAVQVTARLGRAFGVELGPEALLQAPTVAALAGVIEGLAGGREEQAPSTGSPLVEVQRGDGRPPLFLFHPVGGHVVFYAPLATAIDPTRTVYGLQARGLAAGEEPATSLAEMVSRYLEAIRDAWPAGPYLLGGSSMGGTLAYEAARRLTAAGETVALLALLDTPGGGEMPRELEDDAAILAYLVSGAVAVTAEELRRLDPEDQVRHVLELASDAGALPPGIDAAQARRLLRVFKANSVALRAYQPPPYPGKIVFFRAHDRRPVDPPHPERAWIELAEGGVEVHRVPGNHLTMFHHPHVAELGARLREAIGRAAPESSTVPAAASSTASDRPLPSHLAPLPGGPWAVWRHVCLRGAGFPVDLALELAAPDAARAADAVLAAERREDGLRREAIVRLAARLEGSEGAPRQALIRALKRLDRGEPPGRTAAGGEADEAIEAWSRARQEVEAARQRYGELFAAARARTSAALWDRVGDPRFQEALIWQNRRAFETAIEPLLRHPPDHAKLNSRRRQHEQLAAAYLLRYATKNDSIGFFGPVGWARVADGGATSIRPGPDLVARRKVFLEGWGVDALARALVPDGRGRHDLPPRRWPFLHLEGETVLTPAGPVRLPAADAAVLAACDGSEPAREIARRLAADPESEVASPADALRILEELAARGLISWRLEVPKVLEPGKALRERLELLTDPELRRPALAALDRIEALRDGAARAAGDPAALDRALADLETAFVAITGDDATRAHGAAYAGRTLVFEDCRRDIEVELGPEVLESLGPPLSLLLASTRWLTHQVAGRARLLFRQVYAELGGATGPAEIPLTAFVARVAPVLLNTERSPIHQELGPSFRRRWAEVLAVPLGERRVSRSSAELRPCVERAFAAPGPGWSLARHHSPDVLVAAAGPEAFVRGEALFVLGELHAAFNTLRLPLYRGHGLAPDDLFDGLAADLPEPLVIPVLPKAWGNFDAQRHLGFALPATTARLDLGLVPSGDFHLEIGADPSGGPRRRTLALGSLVVAADGEDLVVRTRDGRRRFDVVEFFGVVLTLQTGLAGVSVTPDGRHAPRITVDRLVVSRETWRSVAAELDFAAADGEAERLLAARRWAADLDMPRHLFAKVPGEPKPLAVDLESPLAVEVFARAARRARNENPEEDVVITEMLPGPDQLWLPDARGRLHTSELRFVAVDPAGSRR